MVRHLAAKCSICQVLNNSTNDCGSTCERSVPGEGAGEYEEATSSRAPSLERLVQFFREAFFVS